MPKIAWPISNLPSSLNALSDLTPPLGFVGHIKLESRWKKGQKTRAPFSNKVLSDIHVSNSR